MKKNALFVACFMLGAALFAGNAKEIILPKADLTSHPLKRIRSTTPTGNQLSNTFSHRSRKN